MNITNAAFLALSNIISPDLQKRLERVLDVDKMNDDFSKWIGQKTDDELDNLTYDAFIEQFKEYLID